MAIRTDPVLRPAGDDLWNHAGPDLSLENFEGPLDLLMHLIGKNQIDIADIPIAAITDQYLSYLSRCQELDMEIASEFLVMAATLLHIKARLLLPQKLADSQKEAPDPREELVLRLMAYRRCKLLAGDLREQYAIYSRCQTRPPESPAAVGIQLTLEPERLNRDQFWLACQRLCHQNQNRFNDLSGKMATLLRREKVSLHEKMRQIMHAILGKTRVFFHDLFPPDRTSHTEQVTGFLALLELLRLGRIRARQDQPFAAIEISDRPEIIEPPDGVEPPGREEQDGT